MALRPFSHPPSPASSPNGIAEEEDGEDDEEGGEKKESRQSVSISMGPDFVFEKRDALSGPVEQAGVEAVSDPATTIDDDAPVERYDADVNMSDRPSPYDPLFDDDAEGEEVPDSGDINMATTNAINDLSKASPLKSRPPALALPGTTQNPSVPTTTSTPLFPAAQTTVPSRPGAAATIPLLSPTTYKSFSEDVLLTSSMDGQVTLIDRRVPLDEGSSGGVGRLIPGDKAPPWCMSVSRTNHIRFRSL